MSEIVIPIDGQKKATIKLSEPPELITWAIDVNTRKITFIEIPFDEFHSLDLLNELDELEHAIVHLDTEELLIIKWKGRLWSIQTILV